MVTWIYLWYLWRVALLDFMRKVKCLGLYLWWAWLFLKEVKNIILRGSLNADSNFKQTCVFVIIARITWFTHRGFVNHYAWVRILTDRFWITTYKSIKLMIFKQSFHICVINLITALILIKSFGIPWVSKVRRVSYDLFSSWWLAFILGVKY